MRDAEGRTAYHVAAKRGDKEVVIVLVNKEADANCIDICKYTLLHYSARIGHGRVTRLLMESYKFDRDGYVWPNAQRLGGSESPQACHRSP